MDKRHASDSSEQRSAERVALERLGNELGLTLEPREIRLPDGSRVAIDGVADGPPPVLAEVYAHQGPLKGGQPKKLLADALKLLTVRKLVLPNARALLVLTDREAQKGLLRGWSAAALEAFDVEVRVVDLPPEIVAEVRAAQKRQDMKGVAE